eukprot:COSAG01_NODE_3416_length_6122_cov_11.318114_3_plen_105_part_00
MSRPFSSWNRPILTEIYLCHACSCHKMEDRNGRAGSCGSSTYSSIRRASAAFSMPTDILTEAIHRCFCYESMAAESVCALQLPSPSLSSLRRCWRNRGPRQVRA